MSTRPDKHLPLPSIDVRLVAPESRYEVIDGVLTYVSPADPPHATRHSKIQALLEAYTRTGFEVACDMLTRTSELGDMAPDASVYPTDLDPDTGGRQIERLAFEVLSTERLPEGGRKAARLIERGVGRVFAVDVIHGRVLEWHRPTDTWSPLPTDGAIDDPVFATPLAVTDLLAASTDDGVARALLAKENPVLSAALAEREARGELRGRVRSVLLILAARGLEASDAEREQISATTDPEVLDGWLVRAGTCASVAELLRR